MARKLRIGARYGGEVYKVATADITKKGMAIFAPPSLSGKHTTYPPDGRVHETHPPTGTDDKTQRFFKARLPDHSNVTFQVFEEMQLSSTGPPPDARPTEPTGAFVINGPEAGVGNIFAAVVGNDEVDNLAAHVEGLTSNSTYTVRAGADVSVVVGWAPTSTGFLTHLAADRSSDTT